MCVVMYLEVEREGHSMSDFPPKPESRALLTQTDREKLARYDEYGDNARYQAASLIRARFDALEDDIEFLKAEHPQLLTEIQQIVCAEND